jgi:hypothetical protein
MQLNAVRYLRGIRQIEFKAAIRRNPIKCLLCVKRAKCPVNLDVLPKIASTLSSVEVFLSFASGMVRLSTKSLRCFAASLSR